MPGPRRRGGGRRRSAPGASRRKKALLWTAGAVGFVLAATAIGGYVVYERLNGNITTVDVGDAGSKSVTHDGPMNILVIGTDSRQGLGDRYGDPGSVGHADTTILFHVAADRGSATAMSIPRDIVTGIPDCPTRQKDGTTKVVPGTPQGLTSPKFNESLGQDGRDPGCTMRLVEQMTGLKVDHFMMVNFEAVKTLSSAVGGVDVCLARPLVDPKSHLDLSAGRHTLEGEQALQFVRTRHALRDQSDLDRIKLQQNFLGAMIRKIKSQGTLTSPAKLFRLADTATKALTVDSAIGSVTRLSSLAQDIAAVDTRHITFTTVPVVDNPDEKVHATVVVDRTRAPQLFAALRDDVPLSKAAGHAGPARRPAPDPRLTGPKAPPSAVEVTVLNGSGINGAARTTVTWLRDAEGVGRPANGGNAPAPLAATALRYAPAQADQARALAAMMGLPASALRPAADGTAPPGPMTLTLGGDFTAAGTPVDAPPAVPAGLQKTEADSTACVG
ncbi:LCP family protein [Actinacidiphila rubida]|uniref:Transcriptional attenuator, LytR family n=1 Tax=Actinacidiphila rubida TaxID=310780 RepID=A0A1H8R1H7_9ACTN|nr:LCP family protein [Actinacidiphila rubida]SEO60469.1 transcriptional attenuator, LytR family [Actinacidiphila rubida]